MILTITLPKLLMKYLPREKIKSSGTSQSTPSLKDLNDTETVNPMGLSVLVFLGLASLWASDELSALLAEKGIQIPSIIILTTLSLILAQSKWILQMFMLVLLEP